MDVQSPQQSRHRLRLPLHHHRPRQRATRRNGRSHSRRRHQLQTFHGLSRRLHARRRFDLPRHGPGRKTFRPDLHARRKRRRHRRRRPAVPRRGTQGNELSRPHASHHRRSRSHFARHRSRRNGQLPRLHRPSLLQRRPRKSPRSPRSRRPRLRRNLSAISLSLARKHERPRIRRRQVRFYSASPRKVAPGKTLARTHARHAASRLHRSLPVLLQRPKTTRCRRLHKNSQRRPRHRTPSQPHLHRWRPRQTLLAESLRRGRLHIPRETLRSLPPQRHHRRRLRRRHRHLRSQSPRSYQCKNAPHARRLLHVRRHPDPRRRQNRPLPRPHHHRQKSIHRSPRLRPIPTPPNLRRPRHLSFNPPSVLLGRSPAAPQLAQPSTSTPVCFFFQV